MRSQNLAGFLLLVVGIILLFFGWDASQPLGPDLSTSVTQGFNDGTMWFFIGGALAVFAGGCSAFFQR